MNTTHRLRAATIEREALLDRTARLIEHTRGRARTPAEQRDLSAAFDRLNLLTFDITELGEQTAREAEIALQRATLDAPDSNGDVIGRSILDAITEVRDGKSARAFTDLEVRTLTESGAPGGVVPIQLMSPERTLRAKSIVMSLPGVRTVTMTSDRTRFPRLGANTASGVAEAATITTDDADVDLVELVAIKFAVLTYLSSELEEDLSVDALSVFGENQLEALARKIDAQFLEGNGSGPGLVGIRNIVGANTTTVAATPTDFDKWADAKYEAQADNANPTIWAAHPRSWNTLSKIKTGLASDKTTLLAPSPQTAAETLLGLPLALSTQITLTEGATSVGSWMAAIDPTQLVIGIRRAARLEVSRDLAFDSDRVALRSTARVAFAALNPEGVSLLTDVRA